MVYQGASGDVIKAMADQGAKGIVVASAGAGATSGTQGEGLQYAAAKGVLVVTSTRAASGRIASRGDAQPSRRRIAAEDLAPLKARILLMLALTVTQDADQIQRMFLEY
jgi:L-asparaginase